LIASSIIETIRDEEPSIEVWGNAIEGFDVGALRNGEVFYKNHSKNANDTISMKLEALGAYDM
jgi:hypothetical protein